jgi:hypothetical protein
LRNSNRFALTRSDSSVSTQRFPAGQFSVGVNTHAQPFRFTACFSHAASCSSSSWSTSPMFRQRAWGSPPFPGGTGSSDEPQKKFTCTYLVKTWQDTSQPLPRYRLAPGHRRRPLESADYLPIAASPAKQTLPNVRGQIFGASRHGSLKEPWLVPRWICSSSSPTFSWFGGLLLLQVGTAEGGRSG